jgi:hypothetical protein
MRNYYPAVWEIWSDRLIEIFLSVSRGENKIVMILSSGFEMLILFFVFSGLFLQNGTAEGEQWYDRIESAIQAAIGIFSLLLLGLSILAYRRTGMKKIILAAIAFSLFAIQLMLESLEDTIGILEEPPIGDILSASMTLAILVLFFLAIVRKNT